MALEVSKQTVMVTQPILDSFLEQGIECDMVLPDYCPDVVKILKCSVTPVILSTQLSGDRLEAEGTASVRLYYLSEDGQLSCYEQKYPFEKVVELRETPVRPVVEAQATLSYVNCRAMSQRRVDIHGAVTVHLRVLGQREQSVVSGASGLGICLKSQNVSATRLSGSAYRPFTIREELEPVPGTPAVESILHVYGYASLIECKIIPGKIILKGELRLQILYRPAGEEGAIPGQMQYQIPVSQILDVDGVQEQSVCQVSLIPADIIVTLKNEGSEGEEKLALSALMFARAVVYENQHLTLAEDCYSTGYACDSVVTNLTLSQVTALLDEHRQQHLSVELPPEATGDLISLWAQMGDAQYDEQAHELAGQMTLFLLACDGEGMPLYFERNMQLRMPVTLQQGEELSEAQAQLEGIGHNRNGNQLEIVCDVRFTAKRSISQSFSAVSEITVDETHPKPVRSAALTIFFARKGENVWDIARQYNTSMEAVMEENNLTEEWIGENRMLMIPMVETY